MKLKLSQDLNTDLSNAAVSFALQANKHRETAMAEKAKRLAYGPNFGMYGHSGHDSFAEKNASRAADMYTKAAEHAKKGELFVAADAPNLPGWNSAVRELLPACHHAGRVVHGPDIEVSR